MKSVVTGSEGFIGSHLVEALKKRGDEVTEIDIKNKSNPVDICNFASLKENIPDDIDEVYHLAGKLLTFDSMGDYLQDESSFMTNVYGTYNVLRSINRKTLVVFSSTANLYGNGESFKEEASPSIVSSYGYSKYIAEHLILQSGRPCRIFRFGTVVGARGRTFPNLLVWSIVNNKEVKIFSVGSAVRSLVDVRDVVSCLVKSREFPQDIYNLASEIQYTGRKLYDIVNSEAKKHGYKTNKVSFVDWSPKGYVKESSLNIRKLSKYWKVAPSFHEIISSLFCYYEQPDAIKPPVWND